MQNSAGRRSIREVGDFKNKVVIMLYHIIIYSHSQQMRAVCLICQMSVWRPEVAAFTDKHLILLSSYSSSGDHEQNVVPIHQVDVGIFHWISET